MSTQRRNAGRTLRVSPAAACLAAIAWSCPFAAAEPAHPYTGVAVRPLPAAVSMPAALVGLFDQGMPSVLPLPAFLAAPPVGTGFSPEELPGEQLVVTEDGTVSVPLPSPLDCDGLTGYGAGGAPLFVADFAPGTDPARIREVMRRLEQIEGRNRPDDDSSGTYNFGPTQRWPGAMGDTIELTWSFVPDGTPGSASTLFSTLDAQFAPVGGRAAWVQRFVNSFARWDQLTGVTFTRVVVSNDADDGGFWGQAGADGLRGDIRIRMSGIDGPLGTLAYAQLPGMPNEGEITLDSAEDWFNEPWLPGFGFDRTIAHETGHALGLNHVCPPDATKLMEPFAITQFYGPQHDDVRGAQDMYGDPFEPNESKDDPWFVGLPNQINNYNLGDIDEPLGSFGPAGISSGLLSIDGPDDVDVFAIGWPQATHVQIQCVPMGLQYPDNPMTCGTSGFDCCFGNWTISYNISDLVLELLDRDGNVITSGTTGGGGQTIIYQNLTITNRNYFVRVRPADSGPFAFSEPQQYDLIFTVSPGVGCDSPLVTCDDGNDVNGVEVCIANGCKVTYPGGDCNINGIDDWWEIFLGIATDCDGNGIPDDCETDCNGNGVLDSCDIASGMSTDCDFNGVPDECDPDCNGNGIADGCDIQSGTSQDANSNGVPDECEGTLIVPSQYATLQEAVDAAGDGDTILIEPGTYSGPGFRNIEILDKTVQIVGQKGAFNTTIDCEAMGRFLFLGAWLGTNETTVEGLTIRNGRATSADNWGPYGGAIYIYAADATIEKCRFTRCVADYMGGAIYIRGDGMGGFVFCNLWSCLMYDNMADYGGAVGISDGVFPNLHNCTLADNVATVSGGAVATDGMGDGGALFSCIVWSNTPDADQIYEGPGGMPLVIQYSDLPAAHIGQYPGPGNISLAPKFKNKSAKNYHLKQGSPCRNTGHPLFSQLWKKDIDCQPRRMENRVEMGADEYRPFTPTNVGPHDPAGPVTPVP